MSPERKKKKNKRGVILLIVVSMLTLLVLIGVTFTLFANRSLTTARLEQSRNEYREPPEKMFEQVLGQVLYGPSGRSSLGGHDLLNDLYGQDFLLGQLINPNAVPPIPPVAGLPPLYLPSPGLHWGGQAYAFQFVTTPAADLQSRILDYYTGRVITFIDGPAAGHSTRILQYDPGQPADLTGMPPVPPRHPQLFIEAIETDLPFAINPNPGNSFVINGAPSNGAGAGYDPDTDKLNIDAVYGDIREIDLGGMPMAPRILPPATDLVSLLPHFAGYDPTFGRVFTNVGVPMQAAFANFPTAGALLAGGADESWDAADFQNMFLAMAPPPVAFQNSDTDPTTPNLPILPSYHRPELVNYWVNFMALNIFVGQGNFDPSDATQVDLMWRIIAQPYGANGLREPNSPPGDDPISTGTPLVTMAMLDRVYSITRCSIFRPMPWDHQNFTGSNPALVGVTPPTAVNVQQLLNVLCGRDAFAVFPLPPPFPQAPPGLPIQNLYDVDNDNDGVRDSIWIDPGLPVVTAPDGKRFKRMVSIMIQDLDGRLDMNPHGNLGQVEQNPAGSGNYVGRPNFQVPANFGLVTAPVNVSRGTGYGPAEVDYLNVLTLGAAPTAGEYLLYQNLLTAKYTSRDQLDFVPGLRDVRNPGPPFAVTARDPLDIIKRHGVPNDYTNQLSWYASPPDVWGRGAIVIDHGGQPLWTPFSAPIVNATEEGEMFDNPYQLTLGGGQVTNSDSPYTLVEIEKLLRYHDQDVQRMPSRPLDIDERMLPADRRLTNSSPGVIGLDHTRRIRLAGHGSHIPVPEGQIPGFARALFGSPAVGKVPGNTTLLDIYALRMITEPTRGFAFPLNQAQWNIISGDLAKMVPWEIRHGQRFDINRWLGDGFDSTLPSPGGDGTPDDPFEVAGAGEPAWSNDNANAARGPTPLAPAQFAGQPADQANTIDVNNDGIPGPTMPTPTPAERAPDRFLARQLYARHLYCLAVMLVEPTIDPQMPHDTTLTTAGQRRELLYRRLAQWAINVVEARDADAIMTPFEYDVNPWNGWDVDSNPATDGIAGREELMGDTTVPPDMMTGRPPLINAPNQTERRLVWGTEYPDLLISESMGIHARHVKDTSFAGPADDKRADPMPMDDNLDQFRIPQGSLFVEMYCPKAVVWGGQFANQKPRYPLELYDPNGRLEISRVRNGWPTWRLAISSITREDMNLEPLRPNVLASTVLGAGNQPESSSFDAYPNNANLLPAALVGASPPAVSGVLTLERYVWFAPVAMATGPAGSAIANNSFYFNDTDGLIGGPQIFVQPGQYAIVGPRVTTYLGSQDPATNPDPMQVVGDWGGYSRQRIDLTATGIQINDLTTGMPIATPPVRPAVPIVVDIEQIPVGWDPMGTPRRVGLNITEPLPLLSYYPEPTPTTAPAAPAPPDIYEDPANPVDQYLPDPLDDQMGFPLGDHNMARTGTYQDCASIFLQRLANPNLPYNPPPPDPDYNANLAINPYLTIDWAATDVTVFPGDEPIHDMPAPDGMPYDPPDDDPASRPEMRWAARERGSQPAAGDTFNLWPPVTADPVVNNMAVAGAVEYFPYELNANRQTLGYLNSFFGAPMAGPQMGEPSTPFPWLAHLNRPFASPLELLMVPSSSPSRLCAEFTPGPLNPPGMPPPPNPYATADNRSLRAPFWHLLNFFQTDDTVTGPATQSPQLNRLFDFVEVPSPFVGTERWFNPTPFVATPPLHLYKAPFNKMSRFRDPGRLNINTIFDAEIFRSAISDFPGMNTAIFADKVFRSRRGFTVSATDIQRDATGVPVPTLFGAPFRAMDAADLMPDAPALAPPAISMRKNGQGGRGMPVEATFVRPDPDTPAPNQVPLFNQTANGATDNFRNTDRNAYFRYQGYQKLGNTFTTHSNVFAVWMTIGYFEVEDNVQTVNGANANVVSAAHPDGLRLGQEIGADSGEIIRHRAFYIIDRSVPVGHVPGQKLNAENCVLLRRMIE